MYEVQVNTVEGYGNLKGFAAITFDDKIKVTGLKILEKTDKSGFYVSMPSYKTKEVDEFGQPVYAAICQPRNKDFAAKLTKNILELLEESKKQGGKVSKTIEGEEREIQSRVTPFEKQGSQILGVGTVYIGNDFKINNVTVTKGMRYDYVNMPAYKTDRVDQNGKAIYQDYTYPVTAKARKELVESVKDAYALALQNVRKQAR